MDSTRVYSHQNPGRVVFGPGALQTLPGLLAGMGKVLLVSDAGLAEAGILERVTAILDQAGLPHAVFAEAERDAPLPCVEAALALYQKAECRALLAVGGGSPLDTAKAAGLLASNPGPLAEYAGGKAVAHPLPPLVAVPTTAGTGSEVTGVTVVGDPERKIKLVLRGGAALVPRAAVLDPTLLAGLPPRLVAETGADALSHALEALVSHNHQPLADASALHAIRLVFRHLRPLVGDPGNLEAGGQMLLAANLAGMSFANAGLGLTHALAHPLGAHYHVSHGLACALYLPYVMEYNALACAERYQEAAAAIGLEVAGQDPMDAAHLFVGAVRELFADLGLPQTYAELGLDFALHEAMVAEVMGVATRAINPRRSDRLAIENLFRRPA